MNSKTVNEPKVLLIMQYILSIEKNLTQFNGFFTNRNRNFQIYNTIYYIYTDIKIEAEVENT